MSSTDQSQNDFLRQYCATESDICQSGGIPKPEYTDVEFSFPFSTQAGWIVFIISMHIHKAFIIRMYSTLLALLDNQSTLVNWIFNCITEAQLEPCQTSMISFFLITVNVFFFFSQKNYIKIFLLISKYTSG